MRILHVITRSEWGGAQKVVYLLAGKQQENGHQVTVLCGEKGRLVDELENAGIRVKLNPYLIRKLSWRDLLALLLLWKEARKGYDVIHAHSSKAGVLARIVGKFNGISACFTVHGFGISSSHSRIQQVLYHWIEGFWARFTDALVFVSPGNLQVATEKGWLKHCRNSCVILNGIEVPQVQNLERHKKREIRQHLGIPVDAYVIGNLARVAWIKNPDFWVKVAKEFTERFPESYFIWFGGGDELKSYQSEQRIVFAGEITDIDKALSSFDVLLLTSHSEGMPLAVLEGMARGVPILAPDLPGLKDCIETGGKIYPQSDLEQVIENLSELRDPRIRKVLGEQGRKGCRERFSVDRMVADYDTVYQKLLRK
jgi:glycosyltransferase involved in cell wall biosynthesis